MSKRQSHDDRDGRKINCNCKLKGELADERKVVGKASRTVADVKNTIVRLRPRGWGVNARLQCAKFGRKSHTGWWSQVTNGRKSQR